MKQATTPAPMPLSYEWYVMMSKPDPQRKRFTYDWYVMSHGIAQAIRRTKREALAIKAEFEAGHLRMEGVKRGSQCYLQKRKFVLPTPEEAAARAAAIAAYME